MKHSQLKRKTPLRAKKPSSRRNPDYIYKNGRPYKVIQCLECGKDFERRVDQITRRSGKNYCSPTCANTANARNAVGRVLLSMRTGKEINCKVCGKQFYASGSRLKNNAKFCSKACNAKWQSEFMPPRFIGSADNSGEKNGQYKHGNRVGGHISKQKVREQVIERDENWCLICGKPPKGLHLHRVFYGSQGGKYERKNCVQLCGPDHDRVHSNKRYWQPILLEYIRLAEIQENRDWVEGFRAKYFAVAEAKRLAEVELVELV